MRAGLALLREAHALAPTHLQARASGVAPCARAQLTDAAQVAETLGGVLAETGDAAAAVSMLRTAVALSPNTGFEKYMYLGQLLSGAEGIQHLRHGVALLDEAAAAGCACASPRRAHARPAAATRADARATLAGGRRRRWRS